jgi:hypothetical protein
MGASFETILSFLSQPEPKQRFGENAFPNGELGNERVRLPGTFRWPPLLQRDELS